MFDWLKPKRAPFGPDQFTRYLDWSDYAMNRLGMAPADQYAVWRRFWFELVSGRDWSHRRRGFKSKRTKYYDTSGSIPDEVGS